MTTIRIGGPLAAKDVVELHGANNVKKETALSEKGEVINGYGDKPNRLSATDGKGPTDAEYIRSWNLSHPSHRPDNGCSQATYAAPGATGCCIALP